VIASHQAGVRQIVATAGTALTEQHLKALSRFTGDIRLCFDADAAGMAATERALPIASKVGVSLSVIAIPSGKDPDELIKQDKATWEAIIDQPQYALDWLIDRYVSQLDITSAVGKRTFSDVILATVRGLQDPVEQDHYVDRVAGMIGVSHEALRAKLQNRAGEPKLKTRKAPSVAPGQASQEMIKTENHLLALALVRPTLRVYLGPVKPQMLAEEQARSLLTFLQQHPDFAGAPTETTSLRPLADYVKMLLLLHEELYQDLEITELQYEATRLQVTLIDRYVKMQKQRIIREMQTASESRTAELLEIANKLDNLLKAHKGGA
jgi:DNA primase